MPLNPRVLVLGSEGMLGHKVAEQLSDFDLISPSRKDFDAGKDKLSKFDLSPHDYIINCIGAIPQKDKSETEMLFLNSDFPRTLSTVTGRIIQIATDCVYSGKRGSYTEQDLLDPDSLYGASKVLGEIKSANMMHLRCSIIGPELTSKRSLFEWVRNQKQNATLYGYTNHFWNGVTTEAFAKVARAIIENDLFKPTTHHLVPEGYVTKFELVKLIAKKTGRHDLVILPLEHDTRVDRTLATINSQQNQMLWNAAGYKEAPSIEEMIEVLNV
jgi:dTDP-4-dehydrorhamnose reductase